MDLFELSAAGVIEWRAADLFKQLFDHAADTHDLGWLLDQVGDLALLFVGFLVRRKLARDCSVTHDHKSVSVVLNRG